MIDARFVPIDQWPSAATPPAKQRDATFRASYSSTLDLLEDEIDKLNGKDVTIQAFFTRADIRNDGWPKSSAIPTAPGVIVSFTVKRGGGIANASLTELSFPCDTFTTFDDNLRAIALALRALRQIDRYGVTRGNEQYKGWARLPEPASPDSMTFTDAAAFFAGHMGLDMSVVEYSARNKNWMDAAYKSVAQKLHPDKQGGSHELFLRLQRARDVLEGR